MSTKKKGMLFLDTEWHKHLKSHGKRVFWKGNRHQESLNMGVRSEPPASGPIERSLQEILDEVSTWTEEGDRKSVWIPARVLEEASLISLPAAIDKVKVHCLNFGFEFVEEVAELDGTTLTFVISS